MKSQSQALFILAELVVDVSKHLAAGDQASMSLANEVESEVNEFVETLESDSELADVRARMKKMIDNLKMKAQNRNTTPQDIGIPSKVEANAGGRGALSINIKDELTRELSLSQSHMEEQSLNMNHMNMPTDTWQEIVERLKVPTGSSTSESLSLQSPIVHHLLQVSLEEL